MDTETLSLVTGTRIISGQWTRASTPCGSILLAHGAGARRDHPSMELLATALAAAGFSTFRFNFPYTESGRKIPDRAPVLVQAWMDVWEWGRDHSDQPVLAGGRSMGGRMASMAAAEHPEIFTPAGLVFFAYPLHAPGRLDKLRVGHLPAIRTPMLFLSGTRDSMAKVELLEAETKKLKGKAVLHWLDGADHGFPVLKRSGRTDDDVRTEAVQTLAAWFDAKVSTS